MGSEGLHEPLELLDEATLDYHRAMTSLCEEFEAVDWYNQRVTATKDSSLGAILAHNRDDLVDRPLPEKQNVIQARSQLANVAGAEQKPVTGHFGVCRGLAKSGNKQLGPALHNVE